MMGGIDILTPGQARIYTELLKEPVSVGDHVEESTCVAETDPRWIAALDAGRECPRVDLDQDNELPLELLLLAASEHTRPLFEPFFRASCGHLPAETRTAVLSRVHAGLKSEVVLAKLYPQAPEQKR